MGWTRAWAAAVCGGVLGCAVTAGPAAADGAGPADAGDPSVSLILNGAMDARPGEIVDLRLEGISPERGQAKVVASSPAFGDKVHLVHKKDVVSEGTEGDVVVSYYAAQEPLAMTAGPGTYPVVVKVGGREVARDEVKVVASQRPVFDVSAFHEEARPGERMYLEFDDLYPGETGTDFTVRSKAFAAPVRLTHDEERDWYNPRLFTARPDLPPDVRDGTYAVTLTGPGGKRITERKLKVRAARSGDRDYVGEVGPLRFFGRNGSPDRPRAKDFRVASGGVVNVLLRDTAPDVGEEHRLTATSPAFESPARLRLDDSKAADGDDHRRFYGPARVRRGLEPGTYPVTVVSHHGRVKKTAEIVVTKGAARDEEGGDESGWPTGMWMAARIGAVVLVAGAVFLMRKRRRSSGD
ncbi:hypothetical protein [Streptomyces sp. XD-27]|uniref:hypothetical protein n=1 Tax=Streptomyces sp. XD-27 TaxID=3062779 RepID=UPI0026F44F7F|nr:hypothetical protein [Streptomyces sp. XD-27]WKX70651.1 hypothetical protein Q3Y56_12675 [Streptomyces sp. XD-27]